MNVRQGDLITGLIIIFVGLVFLARNYDFMPDIFDIGRLWPVFVIFAGIWVILDSQNKRKKNDDRNQE